MVNRKMLTSAVPDSRKHIDRRAYQDARVLNPDGVRVAFTGGADFNDYQLIYTTLDKVHAQLPNMILLHGATPTGAERIAACWARDRNVPQKPYKPDWDRHKKAAPFKRNDAMLDEMPRIAHALGVLLGTTGVVAGVAAAATCAAIAVHRVLRSDLELRPTLHG